MKKIVIVLLALFIFTHSYSKDREKTKLPENAKLISQSCTQNDLFITLINLDTNEMVIVRYGIKNDMSWSPTYELKQVIQTGVKINPSIQPFVKGQDGGSVTPDTTETSADEKEEE